MALIHAERVKESSTTTGTGVFTLSGIFAVGFNTFASRVGNTNTCHYMIVNNDNGEYESGLGTIGTGPDTLTRDHVFESSNGDALVNFGSGTKIVQISAPAFMGSPAFAKFGLIVDLTLTKDILTTVDWDDAGAELENIGGLVTHDPSSGGDPDRFFVAPRAEGRVLVVEFSLCFASNSTNQRFGKIIQFDSGDVQVDAAEFVIMSAVGGAYH